MHSYFHLKARKGKMGSDGLGSSRALFALIFICGFNVLGSDGLKDVRLEASGYVRRGEDLRLTCNYDTENESLYALKWYRGLEEFYRFLPKEVPPKQVFPIKGIVVDVNQSDDHNVIIVNASNAAQGIYKCVVSSEGNFQTMFDAKNISVVAIGYDSPKLSFGKLNYHPGEIGTANCTLEKTSPPANITWFINDIRQMVDRGQVDTKTTEDPLDPTLTSVHSTLTFTVSPSSYAPMYIKCTGELYDFYSETSVIKIQPQASSYPVYGLGIPDTLQRSNATLRGSGVANRLSCGESYLSHLLTAQLVYYSYNFLMIRLLGGGDSLDSPRVS